MTPWTGNPWQRFGLRAPVGWLVAGLYGAGLLVVAAAPIFCGADGRRPVDEVVTVLGLLFAAACAGYAARCAVDRRRQLGWLALLTALLGWAAGEVIWAVYDVRPEMDHARHPAAGEVVLLLYPVGAMAALVLLSNLSRHSPRRVVLDGLIVATSLFVVSWVFVLDKQLREDSGARPATLVQVFADVVLLTTAILMLSRVRPGDLPSRSLVSGGVTAVAVADIVLVFQTGVGSYHLGDFADSGRVAGLGMFALAALSSVHESPTRSSWEHIVFRSRLWLPYLPLVLACAVGLGQAVGHTLHGPLPAALGIMAAAVLARQFVVLVENQELLSEVAREAFRDSLTGLANRAHFLHRLEEAVAEQRQNTAPIAVLCLDLDNFKSVNDALGHPAGDELLIRVAGRLTAAVGDTGIVARLGGDEFAVLLQGSVEQSQAAAHRVLDAFTAAIVIDGVPLNIRPSIGFTVAAVASGCTVDELLRHADLAMYAAKREGGQCIRSFVPDAPFPYALPQPAGGATTLSGNLLPVSGSHTAAALTRTLAPLAGVTTSAGGRTTEPAAGVRWPPMTIRLAIAALGLGVLAFTASSVLNDHARYEGFFVDILYPILNAAAAALVAVRAGRVAADRLAWSVIAAALAISALGDVVYTLWVPDGQSPSAADPLYLAFYPLAYVGLLLLMRARLHGVPAPIQLDSLVCGLTMAAVAAAVAAGPVHAAAMRAPATVLVGLVYPWGDLVLLALAAGMLPILGWRHELRWGVLSFAFILVAVADARYLFETSAGDYRAGTLLDVGWPLSALLVAMASWAPRSAIAQPTKRGLGAYATPVACTVVALGVTVVGPSSRLAGTLAALSLIAVAARFSVTFRDVSVLAESHKHAMTDELTALPNRRSLATALTAATSTAPVGPSLSSRTPSRRALLLLELYEFQEISDSIGHHYSDELLCHIAKRLSDNVRREDFLARAGDDAFAIVLTEGADLVAARAQAGRLLEALSEPFALDPITVQVDARIAIALCPDHCDHPQELLSRAETALPHAKSVSSKIAVYDSTFELYRDNDPNLIEELRAALSSGDELTCHYQPKINARDGSVHSVEALLRWHHPTRGLLLPEEFLPAAERAGLMRKVAYRTMSLVLAEAESWRADGMPLTVAVNLSTTNLLDLDLVGTIERLLRDHGLPANTLIIEITESTLVDSVRSRNTVAALQRLGVRISLDDYGTGWSSLARLQDVSVDELKLDRIFVGRLARDPRSVAIVRSTVALARSLGADLVAEGVEDEVTLSKLRQYGCTITQGFVHSPPLPAKDLREWVANRCAPAPGRQAPQAVSE